jgi:hypothetical protein
MNTTTMVLLVVGGVIALPFVIALFMKKEHYVRREIIINAPQQKVFDYIKLLKNQDEFNKHAQAGADRKKEFKGTDGTIGFIYSWSGNKSAGEGEKEIINLIDGEKVETEIRFVKPFTATARVVMTAESVSGRAGQDQTKVTWSNAGTLKYPLNILIPTMQKSVAKDMDASLETLKNLLEK